MILLSDTMAVNVALKSDDRVLAKLATDVDHCAYMSIV